MKSIIGYIDVLVPPNFDDSSIKSDVVAKEGTYRNILFNVPVEWKKRGRQIKKLSGSNFLQSASLQCSHEVRKY